MSWFGEWRDAAGIIKKIAHIGIFYVTFWEISEYRIPVFIISKITAKSHNVFY